LASWVNASCFFFHVSAFTEVGSIIRNDSWNAESLFRAEFFSGRPLALSLATGIFGGSRDALSNWLVPVVSGWWMAEVGSEEISSFDEVVVGSDILSFSPFALSRAFGLVSLNAFVNESDIAIHEHWSAEVVVWDQVSTVAIDTWGWAGTGWHVKASFPLSWWSILVSTLWVAELLSEERFLHWTEIFPVAHISRQASLFGFEVKALHGTDSTGSNNIIA